MGKTTISMAMFNSFLYVYQRATKYHINSMAIPGSDWLEVPSIEKRWNKAYFLGLCLREYPHKIWPEIWYSTSNLGSWNSHWFIVVGNRYVHIVTINNGNFSPTKTLILISWNWLVVDLPLWKIWRIVSWDDDIPNIWKVIKLMFQTTNQIVMTHISIFSGGFPI